MTPDSADSAEADSSAEHSPERSRESDGRESPEQAREPDGDSPEPTRESDGESSETRREPDGGPPPGSQQTGRPEYVQAAEEMDYHGWILVGLVIVCFLVIPTMILFLPQAQGFVESLGLSLRQTYLALPMIPAILLGITAVWAALRTQRTREP